MNLKQTSLILIAVGTLIFIFGFLGKIIEFIFQSNILMLAFFAILIGLTLLGYSIFKDSKESDN